MVVKKLTSIGQAVSGRCLTTLQEVLYEFLVTAKVAPHECVIKTDQP